MIEHVLSIINASPTPSLILNANAPDFTIAGANEAFLHMTNSERHRIVGKGIFDAFPQKADDSGSKRRKIIYNSLVHAFLVKKAHKITLLRYDIPIKHTDDHDERFWNFDTYPVLDETGQVKFIIQNPVDVTKMVISDKTSITPDNRLLVDKNFQHPLFNEYPDAISTLDVKGDFISANKVWVDLLESRLEELLKLSFIYFIAPENFDEVFRCFQKAIKGEIQQFDTRVITAKGNSRNIQITNFPIIINNETIGIYTVAKDITLKIKTEQELKSQREKLVDVNEKFVNILESITDGFFAVDHNWKVTYWNKEAERLVGISRKDIIEKNLQDTFSDEVFIKSYAEYKKAMSERISLTFEDYFPQTDTWFQISAFPSKDGGLSVFLKDISLRKQSQEQISVAKENYQNLFNASPIPIWAYDIVSLRFLDVNDAAVDQYGYTREEFLSMSLVDIIPKEDFQTVEEIGQNTKDPSCFRKMTLRHIKKSGEVIVVYSQRNAITFDNKDARLVVATNITEKLKVEDALKASEQRFRSLIKEGSDLIAILDINGAYQYVSPTSKTVLGIEADRFIGKTLFDFIYEDDKERVIDQFAMLATEKRIEISPYRFKGNKGFIWVETIVTDMTDEPAVAGFVANSRDVTQRIQNESMLKENMERFDIVLEATSDTIWDWDLVNNTVIRNRSSNNKKELFTNDWWTNLVHPEDKDRVLKKIKLHIKNKKAKWKDEYRFRDVNGNYKFILDRGFLIYNKEGQAIRMIGAMQDVTERENYVKEIKDQNTKLREIAWIQSHLVRAPLSRIMGVANLLSHPDCDETTKKELLEYLDQSTAELDDIIRDIVKKAEILDGKG
ncbi:MAG: hypothetical protein NVSMB24_36890 [Mucilaginibacter sp.]